MGVRAERRLSIYKESLVRSVRDEERGRGHGCDAVHSIGFLDYGKILGMPGVASLPVRDGGTDRNVCFTRAGLPREESGFAWEKNPQYMHSV